MELIQFEHNGKTYAMTQDQIEAAYEYRHRQLLEIDALSALNRLVFGYDAAYLSDPEYSDVLSCAEIQDAKYFWQEYGVPYCEAVKHAGAFVLQHQMLADCFLEENDRWENAIKMVLGSLTESK